MHRTIRSVVEPRRAAIETPTRARIDATETSVHEVRSFVDRNDCSVYLERRGGRTDLVVVAE